ncbi:MAG TPA: hypothetical protein VG986_01975 [Pseudolabrys sp.]|nr:hypothetical protein [Pseudolabrys sp.]
MSSLAELSLKIDTAAAELSWPAQARKDAIAPEQVLRIADTIKSASALMEGRFLEIGQKLTASVEILERLTALFAKLRIELDSPEMQSAIEGFARVASEVSALTGAQQGERLALAELSKIAAGLGQRIEEIHKEIRTIEVLTINARITASGIGPAGSDFLTYIGEIGQSLKLTETNLRQFRNDLMQVSEHLRAASSSEAEFDARHAKTVAVIPGQLAQSIELIAARRRSAATAAGNVMSSSQQVGNGIARVVMALQIGDATRQRMEHTQESAELIAQMLAGGEHDRQGLAGVGCALQAAQLDDAASEFRREIASVHAALAQLSADANEIVGLGKRIFGSGTHGGAFLKELESDVHQTHNLFQGFHTARVNADRTMGAVLEIVSRISEHIGTVREVEANIRIMGVNAMLRSSRLGNVGAALSVVAQEVTNSSARTAAEAKGATTDVQRIVSTAQSLASEEQSRRLSEIAAITDLMTQSTGRLRGVGDGLAGALEQLGRDGVTVARLIDRTVASLAVADEVDAELQRAAADFDELAACAPACDARQDDAAQRMFGQMAARYTMAREREVHAKFAPWSTIAEAPAAAQTVDDMLF